jgi:hypothetical protein
MKWNNVPSRSVAISDVSCTAPVVLEWLSKVHK